MDPTVNVTATDALFHRTLDYVVGKLTPKSQSMAELRALGLAKRVFVGEFGIYGGSKGVLPPGKTYV
jgi:hypothetical protein